MVQSICEDESDQGYEIRVTYQAPERLNVVTTNFGFNGIYSAAGYASREECRAAMAKEKQRFEAATSTPSQSPPKTLPMPPRPQPRGPLA